MGGNIAGRQERRIGLLGAVLTVTLLTAAPLAHAQGDPVSYTTSWKEGPGTHQQTLVVKNTGTFTISEFNFTLDQPNVVVETVSSNCSKGPSLNEVSCPAPIAPGATETVVITTNNVVQPGSGGQINVANDADSFQGAKPVAGPTSASPQDLGVSIQAGRFYSVSPDQGVSKELKDNLLFFGAPAVLNVPTDDRSQPGLYPDDTATAGDTIDVLVTVTNPDSAPATFDHNLTVPADASSTLVGHYDPFKASPEGIGVIPGDSNSVPAFRRVAFLYRVRLGKAGIAKFHATIFNIAPSDSSPANNSSSTEVRVDPRVVFSSVKEQIRGTAADLTGRSRSGRFAADQASTATLSPVYIAVLHLTGKKCSWLTGHSGSFTAPSLKNCVNAIFLKATGTATWSYHLSARPHGQTDQVLTVTGNEHETDFGPSLHDSFPVHFS